MKVRAKPRNLKRRKKAPNPLRMDPTRTTTLRRKFEAYLESRFVHLKEKVLKLLVEDDALGMIPDRFNPLFNPFATVNCQEGKKQTTDNTFCPTGEGGGQDNSCGKGEGGGGKSGGNGGKEGRESKGSDDDAPMIPSSADAAVQSAYSDLSSTAADFDKSVSDAIDIDDDDEAIMAVYGTHEEVSEAAEESMSSATDAASQSVHDAYLPDDQDHAADYEDDWQEHERGFREEVGRASAEFQTELSSLRDTAEEYILSRNGSDPSDVTDTARTLAVVRGSQSRIDDAAAVWLNKIDEAAVKLVKSVAGVYGNDDPVDNSLTANAGQWRWSTDREKVKAFRKWLIEQFAVELTGRAEDDVWKLYIAEGLKKGAGRAFDDTNRLQYVLDTDAEKLAFYRGTREEFLRSAFNQPIARDKVELLAGRAFDELDNITRDMGNRMARTLTDGLARGQGPREIARILDDDLDIGRSRALTISRTEIIRAHADGQLMALEELGVEEVGVAVEWSTAGDDHVCEICAPLEGVVLTLEEAKGMLPRHPNCRCAWIPANVGEDDKGQKDTKSSISRALEESIEEEGGEEHSSWIGTDRGISGSRPQSILGNELAAFSRWVVNKEERVDADSH